MYQTVCKECGGILDSGYNCPKGWEEPMWTLKQPFKCPVCNGATFISKPPWVAGDINEWTNDGSTYPCRTCNETGII